MTGTDCTKALQAQVLEAINDERVLLPCGSHSKDFYGHAVAGEALCCSEHRGITQYEPTELVLTARSGTPLREIEAVLAEHGQMLAFEPPHFGLDATLGGAIAAGLAGPGRVCYGSVRDFVLGVRIINGYGQVLHFGGQVMKNVAGYDISRFLVGSLGTLALLLEVSLKVLPLPEREFTLCQSCNREEAWQQMLAWSRQSLPITATAWYRDQLYCRLAGQDDAVQGAIAVIGGEEHADGPAFWTALREQTLPAFSSASRLWRLSLPATTSPRQEAGEQILEWGSALRWCCEARNTASTAADYQDYAKTAGGHACCFRGAGPGVGVFQPLPATMLALQQRLKQAFDPKSLFNPGRLYPATTTPGL